MLPYNGVYLQTPQSLQSILIGVDKTPSTKAFQSHAKGSRPKIETDFCIETHAKTKDSAPKPHKPFHNQHFNECFME